eukprot:TRINITY_DN771_c4_g1_i1.p1 TRINITY_DN771_c4_g1~~TRINITY_DN771_c4_g1_i1.p1  ORF type:complete len:103 (-),score=3.19 TRINITY_DN771_c4_g1_i1:204-512(-)
MCAKPLPPSRFSLFFFFSFLLWLVTELVEIKNVRTKKGRGKWMNFKKKRDYHPTQTQLSRGHKEGKGANRQRKRKKKEEKTLFFFPVGFPLFFSSKFSNYSI